MKENRKEAAVANELSVKKQINYIRSVLSLAILVIVFYNHELVMKQPVISFLYIAAVAASNAVFFMLKREKFTNLKMHYIIFITDLSLIILCVHIFTEVKIDFIIAVFLTVFISALASSVKFSVATAFVVNAVYLYIVFLGGMDEKSFWESQALLNVPFIFTVALHGSFLAEQAASELKQKMSLEKMNTFLKKEIVGKDEELNAVQKFTEELCDSFAGAVIILDVKGYVRIFNRAAEKVFGMKAGQITSRALSQIPISVELKDIMLKPAYSGVEVVKDEVLIKNEVHGIDVTFINDKADQKAGILCHIYRK